MTCDEARELAPEVALGVAAGEERAEALRHLAACPPCRRTVRELSDVADELLMLAPTHEPPAGFESRVLEGLPLRPTRRGRARRIALRVAVPLAAAAAAAALVFAAVDDERQLGLRYQETLDEAGGTYFSAAQLQAPGGARAGTVFGYDGRPSWVLVVVDPEHRGGRFAGELVTTQGRRVALPAFRLDARRGSWGRAIPVDLHDVASVRLVDRASGETLEAALRER